jgi:hypothetical protein
MVTATDTARCGADCLTGESHSLRARNRRPAGGLTKIGLQNFPSGPQNLYLGAILAVTLVISKAVSSNTPTQTRKAASAIYVRGASSSEQMRPHVTRVQHESTALNA